MYSHITAGLGKSQSSAGVRKGLIFVKKFGIMKQKETVVFYII